MLLKKSVKIFLYMKMASLSATNNLSNFLQRYIALSQLFTMSLILGSYFFCYMVLSDESPADPVSAAPRSTLLPSSSSSFSSASELPDSSLDSQSLTAPLPVPTRVAPQTALPLPSFSASPSILSSSSSGLQEDSSIEVSLLSAQLDDDYPPEDIEVHTPSSSEDVNENDMVEQSSIKDENTNQYSEISDTHVVISGRDADFAEVTGSSSSAAVENYEDVKCTICNHSVLLLRNAVENLTENHTKFETKLDDAVSQLSNLHSHVRNSFDEITKLRSDVSDHVQPDIRNLYEALSSIKDSVSLSIEETKRQVEENVKTDMQKFEAGISDDLQRQVDDMKFVMSEEIHKAIKSGEENRKQSGENVNSELSEKVESEIERVRSEFEMSIFSKLRNILPAELNAAIDKWWSGEGQVKIKENLQSDLAIFKNDNEENIKSLKEDLEQQISENLQKSVREIGTQVQEKIASVQKNIASLELDLASQDRPQKSQTDKLDGEDEEELKQKLNKMRESFLGEMEGGLQQTVDKVGNQWKETVVVEVTSHVEESLADRDRQIKQLTEDLNRMKTMFTSELTALKVSQSEAARRQQETINSLIAQQRTAEDVIKRVKFELMTLNHTCSSVKASDGVASAHLMDGVPTNRIGDDTYFEIVDPPEISYTYKMRYARDFGSVFKRYYRGMKLVPSEPSEACSQLTNSADIKGNIALVIRGGCSFVSKALQVESEGAVGVLIADSDSENDFLYVDMVQDETPRESNIPAAFLHGKDGAKIKSALQELGQTAAYLNIPVNITGVELHMLQLAPWNLW